MPTFRPGKPHLALGLSADVAIVNGAEVVWDTVVTEDGFPYPTVGASKMEIPRDGLYLYGFSYATGVPNINTLITAQTLVNGVQRGPRDRPGTSTNAPRGGGSSMIEQLVAGTTLALTIGISGGAAATLQAVHCQLFAVRIGPVQWTG